MPTPKKAPARCQKCGRRLEFIKNRNGNYVPVDPGQGFFIPDEAYGTSVFVTQNGEVRKGRRGADGLVGNLLHQCPERNS